MAKGAIGRRPRRWSISGGASVLAHAAVAGVAALVLSPRVVYLHAVDRGVETVQAATTIDLMDERELAPAPAPTGDAALAAGDPEGPVAAARAPRLVFHAR